MKAMRNLFQRNKGTAQNASKDEPCARPGSPDWKRLLDQEDSKFRVVCAPVSKPKTDGADVLEMLSELPEAKPLLTSRHGMFSERKLREEIDARFKKVSGDDMTTLLAHLQTTVMRSNNDALDRTGKICEDIDKCSRQLHTLDRILQSKQDAIRRMEASLSEVSDLQGDIDRIAGSVQQTTDVLTKIHALLPATVIDDIWAVPVRSASRDMENSQATN
eukprot:TRINITY_DN6375_c0_g1_i1.p1 TRINITY_DN6375_c0_g1~~TRINITY_DN6375_c0_g1_i1.p1  ORF type:complete len:218 (+),score=8.63 TRINITY_DN6375_c0_g1_i1:140-793(+)